MNNDWFADVKVQDEHTIRRKETFEYTTLENVYDVELFINQDKTCYAIGVPREGRIIVYGSAIVDHPTAALQMVVDKIQREGMEIQKSKAGISESD